MNSSKWKKLLEIMERLRGPKGCPWDKEQTRVSLKKYIIEEAYEVLEAIDRGDPEALADELGDLLLQVVFQAQLAAEAGEFTIDDVLGKITDKLIRRHPHVFGEVCVSGPEEVVQNWELIKKTERKEDHSLLDSIPATLPALRRASRMQQRAAGVGFDWDAVEPVMAKMKEEINELDLAVSSKSRDHSARELGDVLFSAVNVARHLGVEAEDVLNEASGKFLKRFKYIENALKKSGRSLSEAALEEMDILWGDAKKNEDG